MQDAVESVADSRREVKLTEKDIQRFWSKVDRNGPIPVHNPEIGNCWQWTGTVCHDGYGVFAVRHHIQRRSHRIAFAVTRGSEATKLVLHHCDNPLCVRPDHLRDGTVKQNSEDAKKRGRLATGDRNGTRKFPERLKRGADNWQSKLTDAQVIEIRTRYATCTIGQVALGKEFGVTHTLIGIIVRGEGWKHAGGPVTHRGHRPRKY